MKQKQGRKEKQDECEIEKPKPVCKKCKGNGYVYDGVGADVHTCYDCLLAGRL